MTKRLMVNKALEKKLAEIVQVWAIGVNMGKRD